MRARRRLHRWALGVVGGVVCVALLVSTGSEDVEGDCGVAPVAAFTHDAAPCRDAGRGQTVGAVATAAVVVGLLAGPGVGRRLWSRGFVDRLPVDGGSPAALDERAVTELRRDRRPARAIVLGGLALLVSLTIVAAIIGDGEQASSGTALVTVLFVAAVGTGFVGVAALARTTRQRLVLEHHPWRRFALAYVEVSGVHGSSLRPLLLVSDDGRPDGVILTLASTSVWRLRRTGLREARSVEVAGPVPGYVVVRVPGHDTLASARPPLLARDERRWRRILVHMRTGPQDATGVHSPLPP